MNKKIKYMLLLCVAVAVLFASGCTKEGYVASKVTINGVDIGSMSREEAIGALSSMTLNEAEEAVINADGERIVLTAGSIGAAYNAERAVDEAIEKSKGIFSGWFKKEYSMAVDVDLAMLDTALAQFETEGSPKSAEIVSEGIMITNAYPSKKLDREELCEKIEAYFGNSEREGIIMGYTVEKLEGVSDSEILGSLPNEYKEPEYIKDENGNIIVTESSVGVVFDMNAALRQMSEHTKEGEAFLIPCEVKQPKHTKEELEGALFRDKLGSYKTSFTTSSANRSSNINLATSSIDGMILMPGEVFSFNNALGERTIERGYKSAGAYVAGATVDQVGGGICQVSSTLYNTVLLSNLEIVERRSHQMTVSYVPMGRDATVNWGTTDFRFKNNTEYPVKLVGKIESKTVTISMLGTETIENMRVEILTSTVSALEPPVETVEDPTKEIGYSKTTQKGSTGYIVDATRVVYSGDSEVSRESLVRSRYNPKKTIITVGTMESVVVAPEDDYVMPPGLMPPTMQETTAVPGV